MSIATLLLASCGRFGNAEAVVDEAVDSTVQERIVVISKQYNEIIFALNAQKNVVAVDVSSVYPPEIKKLPTVGYHRALSLEGLLANNPTLIMHNGIKSLGPDHVVEQLQQLDIPMKQFDTKSEDIESTVVLIKEMGAYFNKVEEANAICDKLNKDMQTALDSAKTYTNTPKVLIVHYGRASNVYLLMSNKGAAGKMIEWAGGEMALKDESMMKHLSAELVSKSDPDIILVTDFGYDNLGSIEKIKELPGIGSTRAARDNKIYRVNECDLVYFGPRTGEITLELQKIIHQ